MRNEVIELVTVVTEQDRDGFPIETEILYECFGSMDSAKRTEFYQAASTGYTVQYVCTVDDIDYDAAVAETGKKPTKVKYSGTMYKIHREFRNKPKHTVEITLIEGDHGA